MTVFHRFQKHGLFLKSSTPPSVRCSGAKSYTSACCLKRWYQYMEVVRTSQLPSAPNFGFIGYYCRFIKGSATISRPLNGLLIGQSTYITSMKITIIPENSLGHPLHGGASATGMWNYYQLSGEHACISIYWSKPTMWAAYWWPFKCSRCCSKPRTKWQEEVSRIRK